MSEKKPIRLLPILVTLGAAGVLALGSFIGCANNFMRTPSSVADAYLVCFLIFGSGFLIAAIWLLVAVVLNLSRRKDDRQ